ncbi:MAG TPA: hypothetical protein P5277_00120 [Candidatus Paceibacterota bacterium]|nr:hypothetical protein [Candidatus Paceibacterota bacterium]
MKTLRNLGLSTIIAVSSLFGNNSLATLENTVPSPCETESNVIDRTTPEYDLFYKWDDNNQILKVFDYPTDGWISIVNGNKDVDKNGNEIFKNDVVIVYPDFLKRDLKEFYDDVKDDKELPKNCKWVEEGKLEIDNYPVSDWKTRVYVDSKSNDRHQCRVEFTFDPKDAQTLLDLYLEKSAL